MNPADIALRFLESVGKKAEAEFYLGLFRALPKERFAAISVDANVARHALEAVQLDLRFLSSLGLTPVVFFGLFEPTEAPEHAQRLERKLKKAGVEAQAFRATTDLDAGPLVEAAQRGAIPIVYFGMPESADSELRFEVVARLLTGLVTRKLIFLHRPGGLRQKGMLLPLVNLTSDYDALLQQKDLSRKERALVNISRRLIVERVPHKLAVAITSPLNLFRELFTTKGAGTLLRQGVVIQRRDDFAALDRERLRTLLTSAFGRPPVEEFFSHEISVTYLEENYRGAALLLHTSLGAYLSKFAVDREAQGDGIGRDLWDKMIVDHPVVFWRSRPGNPIDDWYSKRADGLMRFAEWHVYWKGLSPELIPQAITFTLAQPIDLPGAPST